MDQLPASHAKIGVDRFIYKSPAWQIEQDDFTSVRENFPGGACGDPVSIDRQSSVQSQIRI
jgi:hypothetical protein